MGNILFENGTYRIVYDVETKAIDINVKEDMDIGWFEHVGNVEDVANGWLKGSGNIEKVLKYIKEELGIIPTINPNAKKEVLKEFAVGKPAFHWPYGRLGDLSDDVDTNKKEELGIKDSDKPEDILKEHETEVNKIFENATQMSVKHVYDLLGMSPTTTTGFTAWIFDKNKKENKKMLTRKEMLQKVEQIVCQDREKQYGSPEDNFTKIAKLWNAYLGKDDISPADVAVMMALLKIARISSGEYKEDSWVDLAGYAVCGGAIASMMEED